MDIQLSRYRIIFIALALFSIGVSNAQTVIVNENKLLSPNARYEIVVNQVREADGTKLVWSVRSEGQTFMGPSEIALTLQGGEVLGTNARISNVKRESAHQNFPTPLYKKASVSTSYAQMKITFRDNWGVIFRAYNDGVAYRFFTTRKGELVIMDETAQFIFPEDHPSTVAYITSRAYDRIASSFQSTYNTPTLKEIDSSKIVLLPALVTLQEPSKRVVITEVDVEHYPGMFLEKVSQGLGFTSLFPRYPKEIAYLQGRKQERVSTTEPYMAVTEGTREFPWRLMVFSDDDASLLLSDLVFALAPAPDPKLYPITHSAHQDAPQISWIKPGKVAWDWWNDWRIYGVDFVAGINTQTYKYYIDFASANGLEYVVLDEGWSPPRQGDIMVIIPEIDLPELIRYANSKNVGLILWVVWNVLDEKLEEACALYSEMGIKGFKIDFIDRADQKAIEFVPRASLMAAKYKMIVDFHGVSKPTGQTRTYPNALSFEGVYGLEELKWANPDMPLYDVTWPFVRGLAGATDYTQGAMKNGAKGNFAVIYSEPMSQGTRCHQIGTYIIFESPLTMLCDNPSNYMKEQECTSFIAGIPTTYDETVVVAAQIGEYIVTARRKGDQWFIGGLTNWTPRDLTLDLSFLFKGGKSSLRADLFSDGVNAHRVGIDYKRTEFDLNPNGVFNIHLAPGGGFGMRVWEKSNLKVEGQEWKLMELEGSSVIEDALSKTPFISFVKESGRFSGNASCNTFSGSWQVSEPGKISFSQVVSTRMMCLNMDIEDRMLRALNSVNGYAIEGRTLILKDAAGKPVARFACIDQ